MLLLFVLLQAGALAVQVAAWVEPRSSAEGDQGDGEAQQGGHGQAESGLLRVMLLAVSSHLAGWAESGLMGMAVGGHAAGPRRISGAPLGALPV